MGLQDRLKNNLINGEEQVKKAVEQGQIKVTDTEKKIYDAASEVVDTTPLDNNSDAAPEVDVVDVDTSSQDNNTSSQDNNLGDAGNKPADSPPFFNSTGQMRFSPENLAGDNQGSNNEDVRDTLTDIQKRTQNMLVNGEEQVKKAVEQGQIKVTDTEKKIYDAASEVDDDTSSQDNNSDAPPDNRKEEVPELATPLTTPLARPPEAAEAANKYKGIIQLAVLAVAIAGTVGAYVWGKN